MMVLIVVAIGFALPLALYAPEAESLRVARKSNLKCRIRSAAATLAIGFGLILAAAATFDENHQIDPNIMAI